VLEAQLRRAHPRVSLTDNVIAHVMDVGAKLLVALELAPGAGRERYGLLRRYPGMIDTIARRVGYRVRPSLVWRYEGGGRSGLVIRLANDGIAGVPGVLRVGVRSDDGRVDVFGGLDPGYPLPGRIRQALLPLPPGTDWKGLRLHAELEVKGLRHPVSWACRQKLQDDGSLRLRPTPGLPT
jgi:hypothetical protein